MSSQSYLFNPTERTLAAAGDGFSAPRLTTADRLALSLGVNGKGMMVYDTTLTTLCLWNGTAWEFIGDSSSGWVSVKDFGAKGDGVTDDTAAIQAAINSVGPNGALVYPQGNYLIGSTVTLAPQQHHYGLNAIITVGNAVTAFSRNTNGFPGRIKFTDFTFQGTAGTGKAISITNNTPFVMIENCRFLSFSEAVRLTDSYCSEVKNCNFTSNGIGLTLTDACHVTSIIDCIFDANTTAGMCINGTPSGAIGTNAMHNIALISVSLQNSPYGLWAEKVYDLNLRNIYHEGNTTADLQLGVADAGAYQRFCNSFIVDGWQSSSACGAGTNIRIQHAVGGILKGLAFNSGTSAVNAVLTSDGFCDKLSVDYYLVQTAVPSSTVPFTFTAPSDVRVIVSSVGRMTIPKGLQAINFGNLGLAPEKFYSGFVPVSGRPCLRMDSVGANQDMMFQVTDLERHYDAADNLRFTIDHLNQRLETAYTFRPTSDGVLNLGGAGNRWNTVYATTGAINTSDQNEKDFIEEIPQAWLDAWASVQYCRFKYKDAIALKGDGARWHVGVIAQRIKDAFDKKGLNAFEIGLLCYDKWDSETDMDGNVRPAGERYGVRYEECLALECAYLRSKLNA